MWLAPALVALLILPAATAGTVVGESPGQATAWNTQRKLLDLGEGHLVAALLRGAGDGEGGEAEACARPGKAPEDACDGVVVLASRDGGATWQELPTFRREGERAIRPSLAEDPGGGFWLAWTGLPPGAGDFQVYVSRWNGSAWSPAEAVSATDGYSGYPSIEVAPDGTVHAAWYGFEDDTYRIFVRSRSPGGAWGPTERLTVGEEDAVNPTTALSDEGALHVVWYKRESPVYRVYHQVHDPTGSWSSPRDLSGEGSNALNPSITLDPRGDLWVAWDAEATGTDQPPRRVWAARLASSGAVDDPRSPRTPEDASASFPSLAWPGDATPWMAWRWEDEGIVLQTLDDSGSFAQVGTPDARHPSLAPAREGGAHLLWADRGGDDGWQVRHARVLPDGSVDLLEEGTRGLGAPGTGVWALVAALGAAALIRGRSWGRAS